MGQAAGMPVLCAETDNRKTVSAEPPTSPAPTIADIMSEFLETVNFVISQDVLSPFQGVTMKELGDWYVIVDQNDQENVYAVVSKRTLNIYNYEDLENPVSNVCQEYALHLHAAGVF